MKSYIDRVSSEIRALMEKEDRKDVEFRLGLVLSQLGDVAKYIGHDPKLNPNARPHGTKEDELLSYGQLFAQIFACAQLRGVDLRSAIDLGVDHWRSRDWRRTDRVQEADGYITGLSACAGTVEDVAYVSIYANDPKNFTGGILVTRHATPDIVTYFDKARGIVTDNGGVLCHASVASQRYGMPCIVGTGVATERIRHGQRIRMEPGGLGQEGRVYLLD
jgi:phosphohistidine swiveling domain-containing protein